MSSAMGEWFGGEYLVQVAVRRKLLDGGQRSYMERKSHQNKWALLRNKTFISYKFNLYVCMFQTRALNHSRHTRNYIVYNKGLVVKRKNPNERFLIKMRK